ncbi:hypothetical protein BDR04DRAFT_1114958 [Suillus decipiens]|nr:hypothetical protein BDR04DRAFT_1114958 [Suillus decipiens]
MSGPSSILPNTQLICGTKILSSVITQDNLQLSSEAEVFEILELGCEEQTCYNNPWMNCSSMSTYLDVSSAYDQWKDGKRFNMLVQMENTWLLDMGFDQMPGQLESQVLDMGFTPLSNIDWSSSIALIMALDMGFSPDPANSSSISLAVNHPAITSVYVQLEDRPLDMGFEMNPVQVDLDQSIHLVQPVHVHPDQLSMVGKPQPIGFVIQQAQYTGWRWKGLMVQCHQKKSLPTRKFFSPPMSYCWHFN